MYSKYNRRKGTFKRKLSATSDGAGGLSALTYSSYTTSLYFNEISPFYGNYGGIRNLESGNFATNQSFEGKMRYRSEFFPKTTDVLVIDNLEYAISNVIDVDNMHKEVTFKATRRND